MRRPSRAACFILLFSAMAAGQQAGPEKENTSSGKSEPISGKQLYSSYCALCHGAEAKGSGPFFTTTQGVASRPHPVGKKQSWGLSDDARKGIDRW